MYINLTALSAVVRTAQLVLGDSKHMQEIKFACLELGKTTL